LPIKKEVSVKRPSAPPLPTISQIRENVCWFLIATIVDYKWLRELTSLKTHRIIPSQKKCPLKLSLSLPLSLNYQHRITTNSRATHKKVSSSSFIVSMTVYFYQIVFAIRQSNFLVQDVLRSSCGPHLWEEPEKWQIP